MKRNGSHLRQYLPWLWLLLGVDALAALLLWLADARAFAAMTAVIVLATVFLFGGVCAQGGKKSRQIVYAAVSFVFDAALLALSTIALVGSTYNAFLYFRF